MKQRIIRIGLLSVISLVLSNYNTAKDDYNNDEYLQNKDEVELIKMINNYRKEIGLDTLVISSFVSKISYQHNNNMIKNNSVSHSLFEERAKIIHQEIKAIRVGENLACNFNDNRRLLQSWLKSEKHKKNIEGDFNTTGIAITIDTLSNKKYYTNIFVKI